MFGFGRKELSSAKAAEMFVSFAVERALEDFRQWEREVSEALIALRRDPAPFHAAIQHDDDAALLFIGCLMAGSLRAPQNIFAPEIAQSVYANVHHELNRSSVKWLGSFVFKLLEQMQAQPFPGWPFYALTQELHVGERDADLENFMLGPIFMLKLSELELAYPITFYWKDISKKIKVV